MRDQFVLKGDGALVDAHVASVEHVVDGLLLHDAGGDCDGLSL